MGLLISVLKKEELDFQFFSSHFFFPIFYVSRNVGLISIWLLQL